MKRQVTAPIAILSAVMCAVILISNILVTYPVTWLNMSDYLTWGAFAYPVVFLITDLINCSFGPKVARQIILRGFICAVAVSVYLVSPRIALASVSAFLCGQLLDIKVFDLLRGCRWWIAPLVSSVVSGVVDTVIFFSLSFAAIFSFLGASDPFSIEQTTLFVSNFTDIPRWVNWAIIDFMIKMSMGIVLLLPYDLGRRIVNWASMDLVAPKQR